MANQNWTLCQAAVVGITVASIHLESQIFIPLTLVCHRQPVFFSHLQDFL